MSLTLSTMLTAVYPAFEPRKTKLHLAQWNGFEHPLDVFEARHFDIWQSTQTARNFGRDFVASLIATPARETWMFAGLWKVDGPPVTAPDAYSRLVGRPAEEHYSYPMSTVVETTDLAGRLHIRYHKAARASYRLFETVADELVVSSLMDAPRDVPRFRGYRETRLRWAQLTRIFHSRPEDWMTALSAVSGVYLIVTGDGRQYVGSAYGAQGIWGRWESYIATGGHGGNVALKEVMAQSPNVAQTFQFSILETADTGASSEDILARESHWKRVLGTRAMGLNRN